MLNERLTWFSQIMNDTRRTTLQAARFELRTHPQLQDELEDVVQEAYLKLYQNYDKIQDYENIAGWLVVTIHNIVRDRDRRLRREAHRISARLDGEESILPYIESTEPSPEDVLMHKENSKELRRTIQKEIGADAFHMLMAHYINGVPFDDLAAKSNTTTAAMKMKFHRWRKKLRKNPKIKY